MRTASRVMRLQRAAASGGRRGRDMLLDAAEAVIGRRDPLMPPRHLITADYGDYHRLGAEFRDIFIRLGGLRPDHSVLDVGCGPGRMAVPLTSYLGPEGRYEGFDLVAPEVRWCQRQITPRFPHFRFTLVDVQNRRYNPTGSIPGSEFRFPYEDASFDFAFLTSVFTHMLAPEVGRYLGELSRVLKPGGRCLATWFLLTGESLGLIESGRSHYGFEFDAGVARVNDEDSPEAAVAYPEDWARRECERRALEVEALHGGYWCGRERHLSWQDVMVLTARGRLS